MISTVTLTPPMAGAAAVTLHGNGQTNRNLARVQGLVGPPAPRDVVRARSQADGAVDDSKFLTERMITLEGEIWNSTGGAAISDLSTVSEAFTSSLLSPAKLTVTYENGTTRFCYVKLSGGVDVSVEGASRLVQYQVQLRAADPRWYDTTLNTQTVSMSTATYSPSVTLTSAGTAPSPLTIAVTAGTADLGINTITVTAPSTYSSLVPNTYSTSGDQVLVSTLTGAGSGNRIGVTMGLTRTFVTATRSGVYSASGVSPLADVHQKSEFPYVYPGSNTAVISGTGTSGMVGASTVYSWYDAFW
jgi:hypothetical protein